MNDYRELCETLRLANSWQFAPKFVNAMLDAADAIEQLVKERSAAIADLKEYASCDYCKHSNAECKEYWNIGECGLHGLCGGEKFKWRGVQE